MNKIFSFTGRPILKSVLLSTLFLFVISIGGAVSMMTGIDSRITLLIAYVFMAGGLILFINRNNAWNDVGFKSVKNIVNSTSYRYIPLFIMAILPLVAGLSTDLNWIDFGFVIIFMALVAFVEETIFRGIVIKLLKAKGNLVAILGSSLLFSFLHAINALNGKDVGQTIFQIAFALLIGVILAILMIQTHNLTPLIMYHFLNNTVSSISRSDIDIIFSTIISLVVFIIGIIYLLWLIYSKQYIKESVS
ncbi:MAG: lysostaphin resistance A-like protein [Candidatus Izemoplasmatales bacterium]